MIHFQIQSSCHQDSQLFVRRIETIFMQFPLVYPIISNILSRGKPFCRIAFTPVNLLIGSNIKDMAAINDTNAPVSIYLPEIVM